MPRARAYRRKTIPPVRASTAPTFYFLTLTITHEHGRYASALIKPGGERAWLDALYDGANRLNFDWIGWIYSRFHG